MSHHLNVLPAAESDVQKIYSYIYNRSPDGALAWLQAFEECTERIVQQPFACSFATENSRFDFDLRQALFKTRFGKRYRCVFTVVGDEVRVLRVRGPGQRLLRRSEMLNE